MRTQTRTDPPIRKHYLCLIGVVYSVITSNESLLRIHGGCQCEVFAIRCHFCFTTLLVIRFIFFRKISAATRQNQQSDCAPSEDSDQPGHPPSLIRVFSVRMKKAWPLSYTLSAQHRLMIEAEGEVRHL